jgi:formylglycine-generating enzyme required for sulfatase activity
MEVGSTFLYADGSLLVAVPAGEFIMGADGEDNSEHVVYLDDFWVYRTPVTNL